jgi:hypothetical protein
MDPLAGFDSANELAKHLITLATGILALSITFIKTSRKISSRLGKSLSAMARCYCRRIKESIRADHALTV